MSASYPRLLSQSELFALEERMRSSMSPDSVSHVKTAFDFLRQGRVNLLKDTQGFEFLYADNPQEVMVFLFRRIFSAMQALEDGLCTMEEMNTLLNDMNALVDTHKSFPIRAQLPPR